MIRLFLIRVVIAWACVAPLSHAQSPAKLQRIGVIHGGGHYQLFVDGLRGGLKDAGLVEGKHFVFHVRNAKGSPKEVDVVAKELESEQIDLLVTFTTSVTVRAKRATRSVPIVFYAGVDPVRAGLVKSFAKPGDRATGVHNPSTDLVPKRVEVLRRILPKARRVLAFYSPELEASTSNSLALARQAAAKVGIQLMERRVASADDLIAQVSAIRPGDADALLSVGDTLVTSALVPVIRVARERKLPVIAHELHLVESGAVAAYGADYVDLGRALAKPVRLVLGGTAPQDIPVEIYDKVQLALNLRVAKELGITIPQPVILRADQVIR